jgi:hypothetical protein
MQGQLLAQGQVDILLDSTNFLIGDPLDLQIVVNVPKGNKVRAASNTTKIIEEEGFEVLDIEAIEQKVGVKNVTTKQRLTVTAWEPKTYVLPTLKYYYQNGGDTIFVNSLPLMIEAKTPTVTGDSTYVADIKPILAEKPNLWDRIIAFFSHPMVLAALIMLLLGGIVFAIWYWMTNKKEKVVTISPEDLALERLSELEKQNPLHQKDFKAFHTQISFILRAYIKGRFGVKALEKPLENVLPQIEGHQYLNKDLYGELKTVLKHADLIKFAKASPLDIANQKAWDISYTLIDTVRNKLIEEAEIAAARK